MTHIKFKNIKAQDRKGRDTLTIEREPKPKKNILPLLAINLLYLLFKFISVLTGVARNFDWKGGKEILFKTEKCCDVLLMTQL